ncbi:pectinesterase inhibitor 4-like [Bidens hawaiensis]|uniref:pectinesterase inhibitor 4-like n=1 Tax=Bidens hawaiensis TaxID=980011 RepID=UPI004049DB4F
MEPKLLIILFLTTFLSSHVSSSTPNAQQNKYSTFVKTSCSSATYPAACVKALLPYAATVKSNPIRLVTVALSTTIKSANATLSTITRLSKTKQITKWEAAVLKDCVGDIKDSMDEIKSSIKEISGIPKSADKHFAISNAQTWTSAAITDENSCLDGFSDRKTMNPVIKQKIRNSIVNLARVSSNALYLINHLPV